MPTIRINSTNYSGVTCNISFTGCTGNTDVISGVTLPYDYTTSSYEGSYSVYFPIYNKTCDLNITCPSPTPSVTPTLTPTPSVTPTLTPTLTPTPTVTPTPSPVTYDADYQAILDEATLQGYTLPSTSGQTLQNQLVLDLKTAGIWSELDILYVMATDGDGNYSLLNWTDPTSYSGITNGTMSFVTNEGWDRTLGSYIITQYVPSTDALNATSSDTSNFLYDFDNDISSGRCYMGSITDNIGDRFNSEAVPAVSYGVNGRGYVFTGSTTGIGFKMIQRISNDQINIYNVSSTPTEIGTPLSFTNKMNPSPLVIGRDGSGGANQSQMTISIFGRGSALIGKEAALKTAIDNYMSGL